MFIVTCGDSFTQGEGLTKQSQAYPYLLGAKITNLAQSGASEYLITTQIEQAVKLKPNLIIVGHTSEYRWEVWDARNECQQGFIIANHILKNEKYYTCCTKRIFNQYKKEIVCYYDFFSPFPFCWLNWGSCFLGFCQSNPI